MAHEKSKQRKIQRLERQRDKHFMNPKMLNNLDSRIATLQNTKK